MNDEKILIIGHRNPDADAVCSAIGYAAFKQALGQEHFEAARCGNSNSRIEAILNRFQVPLPRFVGDVTPRVEDIMVRDIVKVNHKDTCARALELLDQNDLRAVPFVDDDGHLIGVASLLQLGSFFAPKPTDPRAMRLVHTSIDAIVEALGATSLHRANSGIEEDLFVRIGAMDIRSFNKNTDEQPIPPENSIIVVGDRWDIQNKSMQIGVRLLVITGDLEVDADIAELAKEKNINLIVSPWDSATTSWIIKTAQKVGRIESRPPVTFAPEEKLATVRRKIANDVSPAYYVIDEEENLVGVFSKSDILKPIKKKLILVDHNELSQAVLGANEVEIVEIIDHHRLGNSGTQQPILFINEPVGSTCTIVATCFDRAGLIPDKKTAGILMGGIIADTLNMNSPTATDRDQKMIDWLASITGEQPDELAELIFSSGSVILALSPEEVVRADMKTYNENDVDFSVSQVEELGFDNFWKRAEDLKAALETVRSSENLTFSCLLVTDINRQNSLLVVTGANSFKEQIPYASVEKDEIYDLPGIVSRKKQLIPFITSILNQVVVAD